MSKKNIILGLFFIFLISITYIYQGPFKNYQKKVKKNYNFLSELDIKEIDKIDIIRNAEIDEEKKFISLTKEENGNWRVGDQGKFYVEEKVKDELLSEFENIINDKEIELISNNKEKKVDFNTDSKSGIGLKIYENNKESVSFVVGKLIYNYSGTYISQDDINETYIFDTRLKNVVSRAEWRDPTILNMEKENIEKMRFQYPEEEFFVEKEVIENGSSTEFTWKIASLNNLKVKKEKIESILDILTDLSAIKIPEQKFENTGLDKNLIIIQVIGDNIDSTITIGDADESGELFFIKRADNDNIYLISKGERDELNIRTKDLK